MAQGHKRANGKAKGCGFDSHLNLISSLWYLAKARRDFHQCLHNLADNGERSVLILVFFCLP